MGKSIRVRGKGGPEKGGDLKGAGAYKYSRMENWGWGGVANGGCKD